MKNRQKHANGYITLGFLPICAAAFLAIAVSFGCSSEHVSEVESKTALEVSDLEADEAKYVEPKVADEPEAPESEVPDPEGEDASADEPLASPDIIEDFRESLYHGVKGAANQKYIVLHDTEGDSSPESVIDWWDGNGNLVASHFIVGRDGSIFQCVPMDKIAHHAGYGDTGRNKLYGTAEDGRDDMRGSSPIGSWASDYGMNTWSIGIEMVHVGGSGDYPKAQLEALDSLIGYIDAYYGFESRIIDHKAWRTGNSDTSAEFAKYLESYQSTRTHDGS